MTNPKDPQAELREAILWAIKSQFEGLDCSHLGHKDEEAARLPNDALEYATDDVLAVFQAREQQLLNELLGELPENKTRVKDLEHIEKHELFQFDDNPRMRKLIGIGRINGFNDCLDQVVSAIERKLEGLSHRQADEAVKDSTGAPVQNKTNDGGRDGASE